MHLVVQNQTPALNHAAKVFFQDVCGFELVISSLPCENPHAISIDYALNSACKPFQYIEQRAFLNRQEDLNPDSMVSVNGLLFPFATRNESLLSFDPIALTWFLMLLPQEQLGECGFDKHHRPESHHSWIVKQKQHQYPLIDIAADLLISKLAKHYPDVEFPIRKRFFEPTFDVDIAFAHKAKSLVIHGLGTASLVLKRDFSQLKERINVWRKAESDPYDVFDELLDILEEHQLNAVFFAMTANRSKFDRNNHYKSRAYRALLKRISEKHSVGLHPGYVSAKKPSLVGVEKKRLEDILGKEVTSVRQHFLRQFLPETWHTYIDNGLTDDYSIGYASHAGFKVGTCNPYQAFDSIAEKALPLTLHPFALMEYHKTTSESVLEVSRHINSCQKNNNTSVSAVWHNYAMPRNSPEMELFKKQISIFNAYDHLL